MRLVVVKDSSFSMHMLFRRMGPWRPLEAVPVLSVTESQYCLLSPTITNPDSCDDNVLISIPDFFLIQKLHLTANNQIIYTPLCQNYRNFCLHFPVVLIFNKTTLICALQKRPNLLQPVGPGVAPLWD